MLDGQFPDVAAAPWATRQDLLAFGAFPLEYWRTQWSDQPPERLHREIKRRCDVVGVFPNDAAIDRLVTAVIVEQHDEWQVMIAATCPRPPWPDSAKPQPSSPHHPNRTTTRQLNPTYHAP